jgi:hypothetical protein
LTKTDFEFENEWVLNLAAIRRRNTLSLKENLKEGRQNIKSRMTISLKTVDYII